MQLDPIYTRSDLVQIGSRKTLHLVVKKGKIAIIVTAAGSSNRLGQPKQLLRHKGQTLIHNTVKSCIDAQIGDVYVVLGSHLDQIHGNIIDLECQIIHNPYHQQGMGKSIAVGINSIKNQNLSGVIICLVDQIHFSSNVLIDILKKEHETQASIIVSKYNNGQGPPTYFSSTLFDELVELNDDNGAKSVVKKYMDQVVYVDFMKGEIDIDTPEDLKRLN